MPCPSLCSPTLTPKPFQSPLTAFFWDFLLRLGLWFFFVCRLSQLVLLILTKYYRTNRSTQNRTVPTTYNYNSESHQIMMRIITCRLFLLTSISFNFGPLHHLTTTNAFGLHFSLASLHWEHDNSHIFQYYEQHSFDTPYCKCTVEGRERRRFWVNHDIVESASGVLCR